MVNIYIETIVYSNTTDKNNLTYAFKYEDDIIGKSILFGNSNSYENLCNSDITIAEMYDDYIIHILNEVGKNGICINVNGIFMELSSNFIDDIRPYLQ